MLTQKFLLTAIYQQVRSASAAQIADLLGVSRMSGTRCMDEIEVLFPALIQKERAAARICLGWWMEGVLDADKT